MDVLDMGRALVDLVLPADCPGCGGRPAPPRGASAQRAPRWCHACAATLGTPSRPHLPGGWAGGLDVLAAGRYRGPLRTALLRYKERGRRDLAAPLAGLLVAPLDEVAGPGPVRLVPAPSRRAAARARGGDHVVRLCRELARRRPGTDVVAVLALARGVRDSVGLDAGERAANLAGRVHVRRPVPPGARLLLVDDVVTTGATLRACRAALAASGLRVDGALVLADATRS